MRFQGKLVKWKDDQGFGFITHNAGNEEVFVHIKSFRSQARRPVMGDIVTYEVATDAKGRKRAERTEFAGTKAVPARAKSGNADSLSRLIALAALAFVGLMSLFGKLPVEVLLLYLFTSLAAYLLYYQDKAAAQRGHWRTSENTLHLLGLIGGWPGALAAQQTFRHKCSKASFQQIFWLTVFLNCGALGWLLTPSGNKLLAALIGY
jgi:uncharacterized membrane protein YsdA (DUF1294 family)/cold shock CspA family protein